MLSCIHINACAVVGVGVNFEIEFMLLVIVPGKVQFVVI